MIESGDFKIEPIAENLEIPWAISFPDETRIFVTERPGRVRLIEDGVLQETPMLQLSSILLGGEGGLMGMTLHPDFHLNRYVYLCHTYEADSGSAVKVVRYQENNNRLEYPKLIIDEIPGALYHAGCELGFGPDRKLYITTGDASQRELAQTLNTLAGKTLRLEADGQIPVDNPFIGQGDARGEVWSYGHRNAQGLTWSPAGVMYQTEHGPSGFDGPGGYDEINLVDKGGNYGWPLIIGEDTQEGLQPPLKFYTPAIAPGSLTYYSAEMFPELQGYLLVSALRGTSLIALEVDGPEIRSESELVDDSYGRLREVNVGPDGSIYFSTTNKDGRGNYSAKDDVIYRIYR